MAAASQAPVLTAAELQHAEELDEKLPDEKLEATLSSTSSSSSDADEDAVNLAKSKHRKPGSARRFNPLRWQKVPPVPKERIVSREYGANFFSVVSFQWMAPLMHVSPHI
jgi:ATP-binding cassette subfamily C (CFTR/MRP) protein 1